MNDSSAHRGRSRRTSGWRLRKRTAPVRRLADTVQPPPMTARELVDRLELRERLSAIIAEIDAGETEDVARTIVEGCLEELEALLARGGTAT